MNHTDSVVERHHRSQRTSAARNPEVQSTAPKVDPLKKLTEQIAQVLYYNDNKPGYENQGILHSALHKHSDVGPLLAQYEPCSQIDPEQLKVILAHLKPQVKTTGEVELVGLYDFVKTVLTLRKAWIKAAGAFFGLMAYMEMCEKQGFDCGGPSFRGEHGADLLQWQVSKTSERHESKYNNLQTFKSAPTFKQNILHLLSYFEKMKVEERERNERNMEAIKRAAEAEQKRSVIKQRNERMISRQPGRHVEEMDDVLQQALMEFMTQTMQRELDQTEDYTENGH